MRRALAQLVLACTVVFSEEFSVLEAQRQFGDGMRQVVTVTACGTGAGADVVEVTKETRLVDGNGSVTRSWGAQTVRCLNVWGDEFPSEAGAYCWGGEGADR